MSQLQTGPNNCNRPRHWIRSVVVSALLLCAARAYAQPDAIVERLYPGVAPGSEQWPEQEVSRTNERGGTIYENVTAPTLSVYAPASPPEAGTAIVLLPGGALRMLVVDEDVRSAIKALNAHGVTVFLLKYRVLQRDRKSTRLNSSHQCLSRMPSSA